MLNSLNIWSVNSNIEQFHRALKTLSHPNTQHLRIITNSPQFHKFTKIIIIAWNAPISWIFPTGISEQSENSGLNYFPLCHQNRIDKFIWNERVPVLLFTHRLNYFPIFFPLCIDNLKYLFIAGSQSFTSEFPPSLFGKFTSKFDFTFTFNLP